MSLRVYTFDLVELEHALKESPKIVRDYVKAQEKIIKGNEELLKDAIRKIKELSKNEST